MRILYIPKKVSPITTIKYGLLYNWFAATDSRNIASSGWHVPTKSEWDILGDYVDAVWVSGENNDAGGILKETGFTYWDSPNTDASNSVNFNGRGSGLRITADSNLKTEAAFITPDLIGNSYRTISLSYNVNTLNTNNVVRPKTYGGSIRLVKNITSLTNGQSGTYTGNDGKVYRTICIGTQEWLADNLAETKYRDGSTIPEVTDNTAWTLLTTGARCSYDNDPSNV